MTVEPITETETEFEYVTLCDAAQVSPDGKLHMLGGGLSILPRILTTVQQPDTPQASPPTSFAIAASILIGWNDTNVQIPVVIAITDLDLANHIVEIKATVTAGRAPQLKPGDPVRIPVAAPILVQFPSAGSYCIRASIMPPGGNEKVKIVRFTVTDRQVNPPQ